MNARALAAEVLGTFTLVGVGSLSIVSAGSSNGLPPVLVVPFGFGFALLAGMAMFGHVSGAHFNPAVTLAAWFDGRLNWMSAAGYVVAQFAGAIAASLMILLVTPAGQKVVDATMTLPNTAVVTDVQAFVIEVVLATVFVAVILTARPTSRSSSSR
jgi:aquaporin Z